MFAVSAYARSCDALCVNARERERERERERKKERGRGESTCVGSWVSISWILIAYARSCDVQSCGALCGSERARGRAGERETGQEGERARGKEGKRGRAGPTVGSKEDCQYIYGIHIRLFNSLAGMMRQHTRHTHKRRGGASKGNCAQNVHV